MSQLKFIIIFSLAFIMMVSEGESKRVGCASFGHSCYGGFGRKRSDPSLTAIEMTQPEDLLQHSQQPGPLMKIFPFSSQSRLDSQQQFADQQEKDFKILVLNTINQVAEETLKRISSDYEK